MSNICACGGRTEVLETASRKDHVRRRRRCLKCNQRYSTIEVPVNDERLHKDSKTHTGMDAEAIAAALAVDKRKDRIARKQRERALLETLYEGDKDVARMSDRELMCEVRGW